MAPLIRIMPLGHRTARPMRAVVLRVVQRFWICKWIAPGGRALSATLATPHDRPTATEGIGLPDPV